MDICVDFSKNPSQIFKKDIIDIEYLTSELSSFVCGDASVDKVWIKKMYLSSYDSSNITR